MGLSSKKTKTRSQSQEQTRTVQTPVNPQWVEPMLSGFADRISGLTALDPATLAPGPSELQAQAFEAAGRRLAQPSPDYEAALAALRGIGAAPAPVMTAATIDPVAGVGATTAFGGIDNYRNPYERDVIAAAMADIDHQAAMADQQAKAQAASAGAWSGDGAQVLRGITGANYSRDRATTIANLRNTGWATALAAAQQDAQRAQDASIANAGAANAQAMQQAQLAQQAAAANQQAQIEALNRQLAAVQAQGGLLSAQDAARGAAIAQAAELGGTQRDIAQAQALAPVTQLQAQLGLLGQLPLDLLHGQVSEGSSSSSGSNVTRESGVGIGDLLGLVGPIGPTILGKVWR